MHALGQYVQSLMDSRGWKQADLVRASGLNKATVSRLLTRDTLGRMVEDATIAGLARAFPEVGEGAFITKSAEALGVPVDRMVTVEPSLAQITNKALLDLLAQRLGEKEATSEDQLSEAQKTTHQAAASGSELRDDLAARRRPDPRFIPGAHGDVAADDRGTPDTP